MRGSGIMLRRLNDALPGLVLGIIVYGAAVFLAGIWFVPDKLRFTTGLAIGIALACQLIVLGFLIYALDIGVVFFGHYRHYASASFAFASFFAAQSIASTILA